MAHACVGAKRISIKPESSEPTTSSSSSAAATDGLVTVYRRPPPVSVVDADDDRCGGAGRDGRRRSSGSSDGGDESLHVLASDGIRTYHARIDRGDVRHMGSSSSSSSTERGGDALAELASVFLRPDDPMHKVLYRRSAGQMLGGSRDTEEISSVKVSVRKTMVNGVVRPAWEGRLDDVRHVDRDSLPLFLRNALPDHADDDGADRRSDRASDPAADSTFYATAESSAASSGLTCAVALGDGINRLRKEVDALRSKNEELEANASRWKSTAEKLSGRWETEKSELTERFLVLFNEHKKRHVETLKELERVKRERRREERGGRTVRDRNSLTNGEALEVPDHEDEHDYATYDSETVERLAAGPGSSTKKRAAAVKVEGRKQIRRNDASQGCSKGGGGFVNPHTGVREFGNTQDLFSSDDDDDSDVKMGAS